MGTGYGGLSGPALRPIAMALVHKAAQAVDIPIIGVGGIMTGCHAAEFLMAGATAVQIGSANLADLNAPFRILAELEELLIRWEVESVRQIIGAAWWDETPALSELAALPGGTQHRLQFFGPVHRSHVPVQAKISQRILGDLWNPLRRDADFAQPHGHSDGLKKPGNRRRR